MTERVLDISAAPARLRVDLGRLVIEARERDPVTMPLADIAVLIVSHPQVSYSQAVLAGLMEAGGVFLTCNNSRIPNGLMLPLAGHHIQTHRMNVQAQAGKPTCKRIWQQLVQAKVRGQGQVLHDVTGNDLGIRAMAARVRSGDTANIEAQAARKYWRALFMDESFRRDHDATNQNALLNYGYGVLRAIVARGVCAAGLHPSLGIHHTNRYNAYCLVDDLMEPYRPIVDRAVAQHCAGRTAFAVDKEFKALVIGRLTDRYPMNGEQRTLFDCAHRTATSLVAVIEGTEKDIALPVLWQ